MTGIFGGLDLDEVGDDPFLVAPGTYRCTVVDSKIVEKDGDKTWQWEYKIDEPGNEYHNMPVRERYGIWPELTSWDQYDSDQKKATKFLKRRLREAFDFTTNEQLAKAKPDDLMGKVVYVTTVVNNATVNGEPRSFTNVRSALCERQFQERGGSTSDNAAKAAGASLGI